MKVTLSRSRFGPSNLSGALGQQIRGVYLLATVFLSFVGLTPFALAKPVAAEDDDAPTLTARLLSENPAALVRNARIDGDARRGAIVFQSATLACAQCHVSDSGKQTIGPELARPEAPFRAEDLVTAVLDPSRVIRKGFEPVTIATKDGRVITGVKPTLRGDRLALLDAAHPGTEIEIATSEIEERRDGGASVMPAGAIDALASRQEFLDLLRYLIEIGEGGPERARMLRPSAFELAGPALPEYEAKLDHRRLIAEWGADSVEQGALIYGRACATCHGTPEREGSLPSSPKFWADRLKSGGDPLKMYQTITQGQGLMPPHTWLVPRQKYDVVYYIREHFFKDQNKAHFVPIDAAYLEALPAGSELGPAPSAVEPWVAMDYGQSLTSTYEIKRGSGNFAYKGVAVRLDPGPGGVTQGRAWAVYDHDTMRLVGAWKGEGFIDWESIQFNGAHEIHPATVGEVIVETPVQPGWMNPVNGVFNDTRALGRDLKAYGPLSRDWLRFRGRYERGESVILSYSVGDMDVLEMPGFEFLDSDATRPVITRTIELGKSEHDARLLVGPASSAVEVIGDARLDLVRDGKIATLRIPAAVTPASFKVLIAQGKERDALRAHRAISNPPQSLRDVVARTERRWPEVVRTKVARFDDEGPFGIDVLALPDANPWRAQMRPTGFDFLGANRAAVCTWDGDVWTVEGLESSDGVLDWRRVASGLFQPLGLKVIDGAIYVGCRDQIVILRDSNGDGETDFYECFNSDHQVTEHFHEFAMGLQTDAEGNLLYAKAARHGAKALVPQHGTLLRVSRDGMNTEILARGFRAPNGVCVNDDGTFFVTDQEGHWIPKNRLNWIDAKGEFYGNMWAYSDVTDTSDAAMHPPVCWITNTFDRSPAEPLWVTSDRWGPLKGSLLSLSYGYGQVFVVPHERVGDTMQGGMVALPLPKFPTGLVRGRFSPTDGQLYVCGMYSWAGSQTRPGGFFRIRATDRPVHVPVGLRARPDGLELKFSHPIDAAIAGELGRYSYKSWGLRRSQNYGSPHVGERVHDVKSGQLSDDGRTLTLRIDEFAPTAGFELRYELRGADGSPVSGMLDGTVHALGAK